MRRSFEGEWQPLLATGLELPVTSRISDRQLVRLLGKLPICDLKKSFPALIAALRDEEQEVADTLVVEYPVKRRRRQRLQA
jgi:hypothetical protein